MMLPEHLPFFVYGTLKRGDVRERCWPHAPVSIETAIAQGKLYNLGPYPAMVVGTDWICGELWRIDPQHLEETLRVLDAVEDFAQGGVDLFKRTVITCRTENDQDQRAYAYFYGNEKAIASSRVITPDEDGYCRWRRAR